jgi:hypothetical protein
MFVRYGTKDIIYVCLLDFESQYPLMCGILESSEHCLVGVQNGCIYRMFEFHILIVCFFPFDAQCTHF